MLNINSLLDFVGPYYKNKDIMHNLSHIDRVLLYVDKLIKAGNYAADLDIIKYAAYFHGFIYKDEEAIINWLQSNEVSKEMAEKIITVAWESLKHKAAHSLEGKILHDAHMIEGGKTFLMVKSLITGSVRGQTLEETINYIEHFILNKGQCYLPEAQLIYTTQQEFAKNFIKDLKNGLV